MLKIISFLKSYVFIGITIVSVVLYSYYLNYKNNKLKIENKNLQQLNIELNSSMNNLLKTYHKQLKSVNKNIKTKEKISTNISKVKKEIKDINSTKDVSNDIKFTLDYILKDLNANK